MTKQYFYKVTAVYAIGTVIGLLCFGSPSLSKAYLKENEEAHKRYLAIVKSEEFKLHEERPALHPLEGKLKEDAEFVEHYRENEAFEHEENRIWWFVEYFKVLNSVVFICYLAGFVGKPLLNYLDGQIAGIRSSFADAEKARAEAARLKAEAQAKMATWAKTEERIQRESEAAVARHLAKIQQEAEAAKALLAKQTEDRKQAELYTAAKAIKTDLVNSALRELEDRYKNELTIEKLHTNVDRFVTLMERLS